jgi:hypothetical protein
MEREGRHDQRNVAILREWAPDLHRIWMEGKIDWLDVKVHYQYRMALAIALRDLTWLARNAQTGNLDLPLVAGGFVQHAVDVRRDARDCIWLLQKMQEIVAEPPADPE